ncbi:hypothetical protein RZ76_06920 [Apilactobacillus kunkeei]|uniref:DUF5776 domain-containing protein n=1 Tax=Apilactobacillus kunkeei TaxID=148814 RepID=UPI0006CEA0A7|nr:DUF5776 domain-containing protein [Apilactobacillus kunkeei]KPN83116.1 hypothetical protein RZ76_06920 [Apilactobacillus kunkeei]
MQYNKNKFNKVNDKKVMKKVKKQWVVVSVATLALFGASAYGMTSTSSVVAHASDGQSAQQGNSNGTTTNTSGNSGESQSQQEADAQSSAAAEKQKEAAQDQGSSDGTAGRSQATLSSYQDDYNSAYSAASTAASSAAYEAGSSDFNATQSKASYANHLDAYDAGFSAASSTAASISASIASSNASSAGLNDYLAGKSKASLTSNNDVYAKAYDSASSGFSSAASANVVPAVTGSNNVSQSNADSAVQAGINAESTYQQDMTNAANDAYNGVNNSSKLTGSHQSIYNAAYAGAQSVMASYAQMTTGKGTGTQDYTYYANTAGSGANTVSNAAQSVSSPNGSGNGSTAGVTDAGSNGSTTAVQSSYYAPSSNAYTANVSSNSNSNLGGADDPTSAHTSVVNYDNDLGKKFNNKYYASIEDHTNIQIPTENSFTNNYVGANSSAFKYGVEYVLAKLGINDAETGKWVGVDPSSNQASSKTPTYDFYTQQNPNLINDTSNVYAQAYLGAKQAIQNQFNANSQIQTISNLNDNTKTAWFQSGYSDVQNQANQGVAFVSNGNQFNYLLTSSTSAAGGTMYNTNYNVLKMVNDIDVNNSAGHGQNTVSGNFANNSLTIDGQNHLIDFGSANYNFSSTSDIHIQNFSAMYGNNYWGPVSHSSSGAIYFKNVNYIGFQMLSATQNDVYIDGSVNAFQRDKNFVSPFGSYTWYDRAQNVLSINNMILGANAHFYGSTGYLAGQSVIALSGNLTLGNNSNMTLVPRGYSIGGDDNGGSGPEGLYMKSGSVLNVNNNAVLNVIPDWGTSSTSYGAGGIYVGTNSTINVNGGKINLESNQAPATYGYNDVLLFVDYGGSINVTNGGLVQVKSNGLGTNSSYALVYLPYGNINVANQGNFIVTIPDGTGKGVDLINGTLNVVDSGQSHVILDRGNSNNSFVYNGSINAYTAKVSDGSGKSTIYYKYNVNSSNGITSLDQYLNPNPSGATVSGNHLELESVPSVYFAGPIHAKKNYDSNHNVTSITISGYSKVTDNPNNQPIYIQYSTSNDGSSSLTKNYVVNQSSGYVYDPTTTQGSNPQRIDNTPYSGTLAGNNNQSLIPFSFTVDANTLASASQNVSGTNSTGTQGISSINKVGVYLKYGVNGIYMTTTPTDTGNGDYQIYIDGFDNSGANGSLSSITNSPSQIALDSGSGAKIDSGIAAANRDAGGASPLQRDITQYQKDQSYTNAYDSAQSGYSAISGLTADQLKQILGPNFNIANAPTSLTQDQLNALKNTDAYKSSSNPDAFISGAQQAYTDLLAGKDAANALNNNSVTPATVANDASKTNNYKSNFNVAYSVAQAALSDAKTGKNNVPSDATQAQIYNAAQAQFSSAKTAFESGNPTINANDDDATKAGKKAYQQVLSDIQKGVDSSSPNSGYNNLTPLQKAIYDAEYADAKKQYDAGENAALKGGQKPTSGIAQQAYNATVQGFKGATQDDSGQPLDSSVTNSKAYKDGQAAKNDEQVGKQAALADKDAQPGANDPQAQKEGLQATKDAYAAASGQQTPLTDDQLAQKSLPYQDAYKAAQTAASNTVAQAEADYKNGTTANKPQGNGVDAAAYKKVQNDAAAGATAASAAGSADTPDANQTPAYKMGYNVAKGSADALNGAQKNPNNGDPEYKNAYDQANDGFNSVNNTAPENQTASYKAGQQAKTDSQTGADLATKGQSLPTTPAPSQAEQDGYNATNDAYDVATGKKAPISDADLAKKSLAYQAAYKAAKDAATPVVNNALTDYKNGSTTNKPADDNSAAGKAYKAVKDDAAAGASDANTANSADTPASDKTPAYKEGYNIAKGVSDAENAKPASSTNKDSDYTNAYNNFNTAKAQGENAKPTDSAPANADQATKDGFAYGQGIAALKNAKNPEDPSVSQGLTGKQLDGFNAAKDGYEAAMKGQPAPTAPAAAVEGYNYANALIQGAKATTEPSNDATQKAAYDDVQKAIAQAKADVKAQKTDAQLVPSDGNANNKDVYDKAYAAAVLAYKNTDPNATAASAGIKNDAVGSAAFEAAKADGLKVQGAKAFTDGKANNQSDSNFTKGYDDAKQGYVAALKGNAAAPANSTDAYNTGAAAGANDKAGFQSAENGTPDNSDAAKGADDAIAAVKAAKGKDLDSLPESNDSTKPASYNNAYNAALEDAKQAAKQGIASQLNPDSTNTQAPVPAALADVYKAAANDAQKGYAEGLTGKPVSDGNNASETQGNQKGANDKQKYDDALADFANGITDPVNASTDPSVKSDPVYRSALAALVDASKGTTGSDNSPVYTVANSQALGSKDAQAEIAKDAANGTDPQPITDLSDPRLAQTPAKDKQSYMNAYNNAINGYNAGKNNTSDTPTNNDPADQNAFNAGKTAGDAIRGANDALNGKESNDDVAGDLNSTDPAKKAYAQGVTDANNGYAQGLNDTTPMSSDELAKKTPAYQKAYAQGQADKAGVDAAKSQSTPDANNVPSNIANNQPAADAYKGYAAAVAAVKAAKGDATKADRPSDFDSQTPDFKAAYQKALQDAVDANKAGQDSVANPSSAAARPSDPAQAAVYDVARADASKGYAEGLTGKAVSDSNNGNEKAGQQAGQNDKAKYEAAVQDYANANGDVNAAKASDPANASDPVYQEALKALDDASKGNTDSTDKSPVYAVANSQALAKKDAMDAIKAANASANGNDPQPITSDNDPRLANTPATDKESYKSAFNDAIKGYNAGKADDSSVTPDNSDPADKQAFNDAKAAGEAARGANDALNGKKANADVAADLNSTDPAKKAYAQGVTDANNGYAQGLSDDPKNPQMSQADLAKQTPAYQKAYAQGQADQKGVNEAKSQGTPDSNSVPSDLQGNQPATDAFKGYADAIAAVKAKNGNAAQADRPADFDKQSPDYKAAYQKALEDAITANKAGQNAVATPGQNDTKPTDPALAAVYDDAKHDTNKGMAEVLSGSQGSSNPNNANEQAGIQAGTPLQAAYQAAAKDFANGITDPAKATQTFSDPKQEQAYRDALAGMKDGSQTPASDTNDPKSNSPIYAIAKQQAQNVQNAVAAVQGSQNVANGQPKNDADLASANGYNNPDNKSDMDAAYIAAANAYSDAINHTNGDKPTDQSKYSPADQMAYAQAYKAAKDAAAKGLTDFGNGNKAQQPANPADKAAYDKAQSDALDGLNAGLANNADATKQQTNPAYKQGVDDAAAIQKAAEDAVNGTPDAGKASLSSDAQKAAYDAIKPAADAGQAEYTSNPDKYAGKTGGELKNAANAAAQNAYPNDPLKQAAFAQAIEAAGDAFGNGANAFGNGEQQPAGIATAGYQAAQQAYNAATNGTGKPEKVNGHYPTPQGVTPSDQYDKTFDAAYDKYKAAVDNAAQDTAANGGTATTAANSNAYKTATPKEQAAYNDAATKAAQGIADAKLNDPTKDAQYGTTKDGKFVPNDDTAAQAYAGAKAGYADGKTGATNEPTNVSPAYKAAYDKANADAKAAAQAGVENFAQGLENNPTEDPQADKDAHSNGYNQAAKGYGDAMKNPSGDFSSNPDAGYQKGVAMAKAAAAARDNVLNNGDNAQATPGETSTDPDVSGAAKAAAAAAKAALEDGKNGLDKVTNTGQVPDAFKPYAQIYADAYATVQNAAVQAAQDGAKAFASDGKEGNHVTDPSDKSVDAVANKEGYKDAQDGYQAAQTNPDDVASNPNTGSVNGDEAAKGAAAAFNDVAGKGNAKPGDHATSDNNPVYEAAYQKALAEGSQNASDGAEALFNNNPNNSTANASTLAKSKATTAADKAFNKGLENAKDALNDAQTDDPSKDAQYNGDNANTDAGNVYHATQDAYNAVLNGQQPLTASELATKDPVYAAAYKNALSRAQTASTNGATDVTDNSSSYDPNALAKAVYEKARSGANKAYQDALANKDPELKDHNGIDKSSVAYQATQNAINDYLKNNGNAKEDPTAAGMDPANAQAYKAYYEKAKAAVAQAATDGVNAYLGGKAIDDVPSVEGDNAGLGEVAKEAAQRAEKGHDDAVNNGGRVSDANQPIAKDSSYLTGLKGAADAAKGVEEAKADATNQPSSAAPQAEKDGFNGTVDGYNKAATDGSIKPEDIDAYIADNLGNKSIAYRDAFKNAYLDGLKVAKAGADAANANEPDATNGQNGAAQKAQSQGYKDANNAFLDKLHGVDDKDATSNTPASVAGRQRASQYVLALQDVSEGHPNTGSTDPDYQKGLATAEAAVAQAVADAKANKQLPADLSQIPVPDGSDPVAYRDAYAGILSGFYNGYNSKSTDSGSTDAYYNIAFGIGYAKGKASIPTDTSAPLDFWKNTKAPKITDPAVAKAYKEQYAEAKAGFYDALNKKGAKSTNEYYKESYKTAMDGLAGMRLAAKGDTKANRDILKTKDAAFVSGYNGYLKGIEAAKRTLKKNKKLSAKDLLNKDKLYSYTFKQGLKHEVKIQRSHGKKAGINKALERRAIPKNIYTHHSATYARTFVATYKKEMKRHMPRYIYNVGTIFTHNRVKFTNHTRIREYAYSTRYNSTVFRVVGVKYYKNRIPRYRLSNGAVVTASQEVQNAYYKQQFKKYTVIKPTGVLIHTGKTFSKRNSVRRLYSGEVFHVRKVVKFHGITRLYVGKNEYITSNKTFVKAVIK